MKLLNHGLLTALFLAAVAQPTIGFADEGPSGEKFEAMKAKHEACLVKNGWTAAQFPVLHECMKDTHAKRPEGKTEFEAALTSCLTDKLGSAPTAAMVAGLKACRPKDGPHGPGPKPE